MPLEGVPMTFVFAMTAEATPGAAIPGEPQGTRVIVSVPGGRGSPARG